MTIKVEPVAATSKKATKRGTRQPQSSSNGVERKPTTLPSRDRNRDSLRFAIAPTALGSVLVAGSSKGIVAILLGEDPRRCFAQLEELFPGVEVAEASAAETDAAAQVKRHIERPEQSLRFPLDLRGTSFQVRVWNVVRNIRPGCTLTYAEVARKIGAPRAMRAVGNACARCRHLFAIPCHRVTASGDTFGDGEARSGSISASEVRGRIRPGRDRRAALLRRERLLLENKTRSGPHSSPFG